MAQQKYNLELDLEKEAQKLTAKHRVLDDIYSGLEKQITTTQEGVKDRSKIDQVLQMHNQIETTIADLSSGLAQELDVYVSEIENSQKYLGLKERATIALSSFAFTDGMKEKLRRSADRHRAKRIQKQPLAENLEQSVRYSDALVKRFLIMRDGAISRRELINNVVTQVVNDIAKYEPLMEQAKEKRDALKAEYTTFEEKMNIASPKEQAEMTPQKNELYQKLSDAENDFLQVETRYNQAKQMLAPNEKVLQSFDTFIQMLGVQATHVSTKTKYSVQAYKALPEAQKIAMLTKGMEIYDKAANVTLEKAVDGTTASAAAVAEATMGRVQTPNFQQAKMREILERMDSMVKHLEEAEENVRAYSQQPRNTMYGMDE